MARVVRRITSYNVCYTKLLRASPEPASRAATGGASQAAAIVDIPRMQEFFPDVDPAKIVYLGPKRAVVVK